MAGRPRKPSHLRILEGNPGKRPLPTNEPAPEIKAPRCPPELSELARREWRRVVPELKRLRLISLVDRAALAAYCQCWADWLEAQANVNERGKILTRKHKKGSCHCGKKHPEAYETEFYNPYVGIANTALKQLKAFLGEFGLSPATRSKVAVIPDAPDPDLEEFFGPGG